MAAVRAGLVAAADPARAPAMQAYMKSDLPYHGIPMPDIRKLARAVYADHRLTARQDWERAVRTLYDDAAFREERYAALTLAGHRFYREFQTPESLPLYEHLIVTGAWWDLVDDVSHRVGDVLRGHRAATGAVIRAWSVRPDRWLRRTAIICQLGHRRETDPAAAGGRHHAQPRRPRVLRPEGDRLGAA